VRRKNLAPKFGGKGRGVGRRSGKKRRPNSKPAEKKRPAAQKKKRNVSDEAKGKKSWGIHPRL